MTVSKNQELEQYIAKKIKRLQAAHLGDNPRQQARARAVLAKLRQAPFSGEPVHSAAWQLVLGTTGLASANTEAEEIFPKELQGKGDLPSMHELAAYASMLSYAVHQQSQTEAMHIRDKKFAYSVGEMVAATSPSSKMRFDSLNKAQTPSNINYHLRSLITLLRAQSIGFDYGILAADLAQLYSAKYRNAPLMRFSRDFVNGYLKKTEEKPVTK